MTDIEWAEEKGDAVAKEWLESVRNPLGLGIRIKHALLEAERRGRLLGLEEAANVCEVAPQRLSPMDISVRLREEIRKLKGD